MRIPPYYRMPLWQRFFSGIVVGITIGWLIFVSIYGMAQERQINKIKSLQAQNVELTDNNKVLLEEKQKHNEELQKKLTIQAIKVYIQNTNTNKISGITRLELQNAIEKQVHSLINQDIETVANNQPLVFQAIEGATYNIDDTAFKVKIQSLVIYTTLQMTVTIKDEKISRRS